MKVPVNNGEHVIPLEPFTEYSTYAWEILNKILSVRLTMTGVLTKTGSKEKRQQKSETLTLLNI